MRSVKLLGQGLMARDFDRQVAEFHVHVAVLNGYTAPGIPVTKGAGIFCPGKGAVRPSADLCNRAELIWPPYMYGWSDLRIFLAVGREGSTLAASRLLNKNLTTVSCQTLALEHVLGLTLFARSTRGFTLTPQGHALLHKCEAV